MPGARSFRFNVVGNYLSSRSEWHELARKVEGMGFSTLLVPDHLGFPSAMARLVSAADATSSLRVGTRVLNNDFYHPLRLAQEAATVDVLTEGRFELGLGSGWARPEYERLGIAFDPAPVRAQRLGSAIETMRQAWATAAAESNGAVAPMQRPRLPVMIGGQHDSILTVAAEHADVVGFTGATLRGGQLHPHCVLPEELRQRVEFLRAAAGERFGDIELGLRTIVVNMAGDRDEVAARLAAATGVPAEAIVASPFALVGSPGQVRDKLLEARETIGVSCYDVPSVVVDDIAPVVAELTS